MLILGLNAYHADSSACVIKDGDLIAAAEQERFNRIKHWAGFPEKSIKYCLSEAGAGISDLDYIAVNRNPKANLYKKTLFALRKSPDFSYVKDRVRNSLRISSLEESFRERFDMKSGGLRAKIMNVEHHLAHLASSFFLSGMERAALCSVDGFGDFVSTMVGVGEGNNINVMQQIYFPHSLGLFYLALTQYLGFKKYGDEYKVMGLSSYGKPKYKHKMRDIVRVTENGRFELGLDYFVHHSEGVTMTWDEGEPQLQDVFSERMVGLLGPARKSDEEINERHMDIAASMQATYEEAFFSVLVDLQKKTGETNLCLAGGCAMNSVANGKILEKTKFKDVFIQPAAGDAGGAIGSAYYLYNCHLGNERIGKMKNAFLGPGYSTGEIMKTLSMHKEFQEGLHGGEFNCSIATSECELLEKTSDLVADGKVVGWFQGRMEWGPRALGNRSIIVDPRKEEMKKILNDRIKRRESFRPFAPSVLREAVGDYFETDYAVPFMLMVFKVKPEKRNEIPAVTHIDGSGRLQTVAYDENPLFYKLIKRFSDKTGVPVLLNTSFNENEPIVNSPEEALECFKRTRMDAIVIGNRIIERKYK